MADCYLSLGSVTLTLDLIEQLVFIQSVVRGGFKPANSCSAVKYSASDYNTYP